MINNRIRTIVRTAAGTALLASVLGVGAVGAASVANAAPVQNAPQIQKAQDRLYCQYYDNEGYPTYWHWGPCP